MLDILYKKVAKIALGVKQTESSLNVYKDMKWLPLHLRRQVHISLYILKIIKCQCPSNFINKSTLSLEAVEMELTVIYIHLSLPHLSNFTI